ncbi:MAG TPA: VanZ family protein [Candidatus Polarisedimenticolia bacterium]|nr:VanZ family protein [Candidatus Polarisedimenticolia bacterium]
MIVLDVLRSRVTRLLIAGAMFAAYLAFGWSPAVPSGQRAVVPHGSGVAAVRERREMERRIDYELPAERTSPDLVFNLLGFLPLGALLSLFWPRMSMSLATSLCAGLSFLIETGQLVLPGHYPSIVDLTLNTLGGALGWRLARLLLSHPSLVALWRPHGRS